MPDARVAPSRVPLQSGGGGRPLLDNGRGSSRMAVLSHKHEIETGHTSSIGQRTLGYSAAGQEGGGWGGGTAGRGVLG